MNTKTKRLIMAFLSGALFAIGLGVAQMTRPDRVIGFLDFFGEWDPTLVGVMGGGVLVYFLLWKPVTGRPSPVFADAFQIPTRTDLTPRLIAGSALFGVGWGIAGFCPGPAIASLPTGASDVLVFVVSMVAGMLLFRMFNAARPERSPATAASSAS